MQEVIYIKTDYVPERHKGYIIPGKVYKARKNLLHKGLYDATFEKNSMIYTISLEACAYLDGRDWQVVETKEENSGYVFTLEKTITIHTKHIVLVKLLKKLGFNYKLSELGRLL